LVEGGPSRQETVARCLQQVAADAEVVLVHDAVRPFIELEMIPRVIAAARQDGAAILGIPSVDTVKQVQRHMILGSIPRERIVLAQTPQAFRYPIIREAYARAAADGFHGTDDSSLAERLGYNVTVIMGSDRNIKITKPSDLPLARLYLAQERDQQVAAG
jgi:2-C-methyl-D-erythritol 4-phosphate cytidylyltransferase